MIIGIWAEALLCKNKTGVELYLENLIRAIAEKDKKNIYLLYTTRPLKGFFSFYGNNFKNETIFYKLPFLKTQLGLSFFILMQKMGFTKKIDVLFIPAHVLPIINQKNSVVTIHGVEFEKYPKYYGFFQKQYLKWSTKFALRYAKKIIVPTNYVKKELVRIYGADSGKINVVHHGINKTTDDKETLNEKLKMILTSPYFLYIGRIEHKKNILSIISLFSFLKENYNINQNLVLVGGQGKGYREIKKEILKNKHKDGIFLLGYVDDSIRNFLLKNATLFLFLSHDEGFGLPILEAQAAGVPIVLSNIEVFHEVAGKGALFINIKNIKKSAADIYHLLNNKKAKENFIKKGAENIKMFSWEITAEETLKVLNNL